MSENNVKIFREEKAWAIVDLAKKAGLTPQTVSKMEKGLKTRRTSELKVALALEKKHEEIFINLEN